MIRRALVTLAAVALARRARCPRAAIRIVEERRRASHRARRAEPQANPKNR